MGKGLSHQPPALPWCSPEESSKPAPTQPSLQAAFAKLPRKSTGQEESPRVGFASWRLSVAQGMALTSPAPAAQGQSWPALEQQS